jgi:hypothetical protein
MYTLILNKEVVYVTVKRRKQLLLIRRARLSIQRLQLMFDWQELNRELKPEDRLPWKIGQ